MASIMVEASAVPTRVAVYLAGCAFQAVIVLMAYCKFFQVTSHEEVYAAKAIITANCTY